MEKYKVIKKLGSGSFGNVEMAENKETGEVVAIKRLKKKYGTWEECLQLAEVKALRKMQHPSIIRLKEVIRVVNEAYFVFQYIEKDLYRLMTDLKQSGKQLTESEIRYIARQMAEALQYIHRQGFFHRDLKPENLLVASNLNIKIIDFGIAREIRSKPPYTEYVSTRWYRAPEMLFKFSTYSAPVDVFAVGCIVAEMYMGKPLFLGSSELDQISKITSVLGSPTKSWPQGIKQAQLKGIGIPEYPELPLSTVIPNCPSDALNFIGECLKWDPSKRITAAQMINHPFLRKENYDAKIPHHQIHLKKISSMGSSESPLSYKIEREASSPLKTTSAKNQFDKDEEFDQLLNDFKGYQVSGQKDKVAEEEAEEEWF